MRPDSYEKAQAPRDLNEDRERHLGRNVRPFRFHLNTKHDLLPVAKLCWSQRNPAQIPALVDAAQIIPHLDQGDRNSPCSKPSMTPYQRSVNHCFQTSRHRQLPGGITTPPTTRKRRISLPNILLFRRDSRQSTTFSTANYGSSVKSFPLSPKQVWQRIRRQSESTPDQTTVTRSPSTIIFESSTTIEDECPDAVANIRYRVKSSPLLRGQV